MRPPEGREEASPLALPSERRTCFRKDSKGPPNPRFIPRQLRLERSKCTDIMIMLRSPLECRSSMMILDDDQVNSGFSLAWWNGRHGRFKIYFFIEYRFKSGSKQTGGARFIDVHVGES